MCIHIRRGPHCTYTASRDGGKKIGVFEGLSQSGSMETSTAIFYIVATMEAGKTGKYPLYLEKRSSKNAATFQMPNSGSIFCEHEDTKYFRSSWADRA